MKNRLPWLQGILLLVVVAVLVAMAFKPPAPAKRKTVIVELFTSEGCSSCPPADALLSRLGQDLSSNGAEVLPLGFHVDYWDHQGWRDRFSSHAFTERQQSYATRFRLESPYTPQMVVDGQTEFVGNDSGRAENAIVQAAAHEQEADVQLAWTAPDKLMVRVTGAKNAKPAEVRLAITEDNLSSNVARGENEGRTLRHSAVVRDFRLLGKVSNGEFQKEVTIKREKDWKLQDLRAIAFVQMVPDAAIEGAASIRFASSLSAGN